MQNPYVRRDGLGVHGSPIADMEVGVGDGT